MSKFTLASLLHFFQTLTQRSLVASMATIISTCALGVSLFQAHLARKQQMASVWPYLSIGGQSTSGGLAQTWSIKLTNNGLGPAILEKVDIAYEGQTFSFDSLAQRLYAQHAQLDSIKNINYAMNSVGPGTVIPAGEAVEWLSFDFSFSGKPSGPLMTRRSLEGIRLRVQYKSLYGEQWESCMNCEDGRVEQVRSLD